MRLLFIWRNQMRSSITLKEIPYVCGDYDALNYCDVGADRNFEIIADDIYTIGHVYISEKTETANGISGSTYINWIEFLSIFNNKKLLRPTLEALSEMFGELYLEASDKLVAKYESTGCKKIGLDDLTGLTVFKYERV